VRQLHKRRVRRAEKCYLIEGRRLVAQALFSESDLALAFFTETFAQTKDGGKLIAALAQSATPIWSVSPEAMAHMAGTVTPQGILAVAAMPRVNPCAIREASLVVILDNLRDPGNVGTVMRTSQATGVDWLLLSSGSADAYSPKVVRGAMGAHFALPILQELDWPQIGALLGQKRVVVADAQGDHTPWEMDWASPVALIIGSEAHGPSQSATDMATDSVRLPMSPRVESLNAAIATAVILFEIYHQRHTT